ncbi:MAG: hypothetical protein EOQ55_12570 [Mesorhizobium sp.]|uniref:hypothetical protein n=1 Tax=Mesorhizobium sp. TaxID=1871066 RepID=UPI000FE55096|nr:hypothetical protein [Mesorhizobium sp.]RWG20124.1 MAG: hypothetical protein EOQ55_12570 [Mesorhizobium sp.]RWI96179.1 MAG: hypothetical protein EOR21_09170 [Mesorhizobium sp.]
MSEIDIEQERFAFANGTLEGLRLMNGQHGLDDHDFAIVCIHFGAHLLAKCTSPKQAIEGLQMIASGIIAEHNEQLTAEIAAIKTEGSA